MAECVCGCDNSLPLVAVLATGGTIAGRAETPGKATEYASGVLGVGSLVSAVPEMAKVARIRQEQVANIGSEDMTDAVWLALARRINAVLADPEVAGCVVTHGTDTMEETAYFLNLVVKSPKPVVLTGAMRPANAVAADGPANLLDAVALAASREACGHGVLVVFNNRILSAREAVKVASLNLDAFDCPGFGPLGFMADGAAHMYRTPLRRHTTASEFDTAALVELPRVEIIHGHAGQRPDLVNAAVAAGAAGIVHAGVGMGNIHANVKPALAEAVRRGVVVACSTRVVASCAAENRHDAEEFGFVYADTLNPGKTRVLLQLALTVTREFETIRGFFNAY